MWYKWAIEGKCKFTLRIEPKNIEITVKQDTKIEELEICNEYKKVYDVIENFPININQICKKAKISIAEANQTLTMLEIEGLIRSLPNNEYIKG